MHPTLWDELQDFARLIVERTIRELPPEIRAEAEEIPCLFEPECADDPEILGIYCEFTPGEVSEANGPIILYLRTLEEYCLEEGADLATEIRLTYLHELGHHFGWDEEDLEARGLE
jgi:predicted Zn-dependent protease with MMP-like domain